MKKQIISMIAASLMLVAPCVNAGPVAQFMNRAAHCISRMMPASRRLPKEMLDEIVKMKEKSSNSTPVICINSERIDASGRGIASAQSIGFSPFHFSILRFNLDHMKTLQGSPFGNTCTLAIIAHELEHAKQNHGEKERALLLKERALLHLKDKAFLAGTAIYYTSLGSIALQHYLALPEYPIDPFLTATGAAAFLMVYGINLRKNNPGLGKNNPDPAIRKKWELEAETGAYSTMARCGYRQDIEILSRHSSDPRALIHDEWLRLKTAITALNRVSNPPSKEHIALEKTVNDFSPEAIITMSPEVTMSPDEINELFSQISLETIPKDSYHLARQAIASTNLILRSLPIVQIHDGLLKLKTVTRKINSLSCQPDQKLITLEERLNDLSPETIIKMSTNEVTALFPNNINPHPKTPEDMEYQEAYNLLLNGSKGLDTFRPMGAIYPTLRETIAYQEAALKECDQHPDTEAPKILASPMLAAPRLSDSASMELPFALRDVSRGIVSRFLSIEKVRAHYAQKPEAWFCNSRSKQLLFSLGQISKPDRFYTENILPADERPDQEYIDELYKMIEVRKNDTRLAKWPVILKKADLSKVSDSGIQAQAYVDNRPDTHSIVRIDQKAFEKKVCPAYNTYVLAHELGHVIKGHLGTYDDDLIKRQNLEAEIEAYKTLAQCGYYKAINTLRNRSLALDIMHTPRGKYFPNVHEELGYQTQALNECRKDVDPKDTQDSKHLMRNGQTWTQWFSSFFGGGK